jgi:hypothetical protein
MEYQQRLSTWRQQELRQQEHLEQHLAQIGLEEHLRCRQQLQLQQQQIHHHPQPQQLRHQPPQLHTDFLPTQQMTMMVEGSHHQLMGRLSPAMDHPEEGRLQHVGYQHHPNHDNGIHHLNQQRSSNPSSRNSGRSSGNSSGHQQQQQQ